MICAVSLVAVIYCMAGGLGLEDSLDFGAGAYYYADIPDFEKYLAWDAYDVRLPWWVFAILFFLWGFVVYKLWVRIDRGKKNKKD